MLFRSVNHEETLLLAAHEQLAVVVRVYGPVLAQHHIGEHRLVVPVAPEARQVGQPRPVGLVGEGLVVEAVPQPRAHHAQRVRAAPPEAVRAVDLPRPVAPRLVAALAHEGVALAPAGVPEADRRGMSASWASRRARAGWTGPTKWTPASV